MGCAARKLNAVIMLLRSRSRRPVAVSVKKSLGQWRRVVHALRWPRRQPRQVRQCARAPWAVWPVLHGAKLARAARHGIRKLLPGRLKPQPLTWRGVYEQEPRQRRWVEHVLRWPRRQPRQVLQRAHAPWEVSRFSTGRSARRPVDAEVARYSHGVWKPQPPTWRGVGEEEPRRPSSSMKGIERIGALRRSIVVPRVKYSVTRVSEIVRIIVVGSNRSVVSRSR